MLPTDDSPVPQAGITEHCEKYGAGYTPAAHAFTKRLWLPFALKALISVVDDLDDREFGQPFRVERCVPGYNARVLRKAWATSYVRGKVPITRSISE
jgi:hypothetical protein